MQISQVEKQDWQKDIILVPFWSSIKRKPMLKGLQELHINSSQEHLCDKTTVFGVWTDL